MDKKVVTGVTAGAAVLIVMVGIAALLRFNAQVDDWIEREIAPVVEQHREDMDEQSGRDDGQDARIQGLITTLNNMREQLDEMRADSAAKRNAIEDEAVRRFLDLMDSEAVILQRLARLEALEERKE